MEIKDEATIVIKAPPAEVWEEAGRPERWPMFSGYFREVRPEGEGWRFVYRGAQDVDLSFVLRPTALEPQRFVEFETVKTLEHNADVRGWVRLEEEEGDTRVTLYVEGKGEQGDGLTQKLVDWWTYLFVEHGKNLKVLLQDLKTHFEGEGYTPPERIASGFGPDVDYSVPPQPASNPAKGAEAQNRPAPSASPQPPEVIGGRQE